jgi:hypothetical protein
MAERFNEQTWREWAINRLREIAAKPSGDQSTSRQDVQSNMHSLETL